MIIPTACGWVCAEALAEQGLEEAQSDAAVERAPRGEGDQQALGPIGIADRGARLGADLADPLLERGDPAGDFGVDHDPLGLVRRRRRSVGLRPTAAAGGGSGRAGARRPAPRGRARRRSPARRRPSATAASPSRRARAGRRGRAGAARRSSERRGGPRIGVDRIVIAVHAPASLAQLGGKLQQGLVARRCGDRDRPPALARRFGRSGALIAAIRIPARRSPTSAREQRARRAANGAGRARRRRAPPPPRAARRRPRRRHRPATRSISIAGWPSATMVRAAGVEGALDARPLAIIASRAAPSAGADADVGEAGARPRPRRWPRRPHSRAGREMASSRRRRGARHWRWSASPRRSRPGRAASRRSGRTVNSGATTGSSPSARARAAVSPAPGCGRRISTGHSSLARSRG